MKNMFLPLLALLCLIFPARAADFYDLPENHWAGTEIRQALDAGVMNGCGDGSFQSARGVTASQFCAMLCRSFLAEESAAAPEGKYRAQAAVIWSRLDALLNGPRETPADPDAGVEAREMPAVGLQGEETIQEMMNRVNRATPLCQEGRLPNGKARTEENILELLKLAKRGCPDGTVWSDTTRYDYMAPGLGPTHGSLSFGMAVSDFLFGEEAPVTQHLRLPALEVGDVERVLVLTDVDREGDIYTACELVRNGKVDWYQWGPVSGLVDAPGFTTVYRRWK